jgi:hypothetical protein
MADKQYHLVKVRKQTETSDLADLTDLDMNNISAVENEQLRKKQQQSHT